jgi:hypothetical protein
MGVSLGYTTDSPVTPEVLEQLTFATHEKNRSRDWWCESVWISDEVGPDGGAFGFTKLFCMIEDDDTDTYMAYLDICEIVRFLQAESVRLGVSWKLEIEASPFGRLTSNGPDRELRENLDTFLEMFPGDFESLKSRSREDILAQWSDR